MLMNLPQKRVAVSIYSFFFLAIFVAEGIRFSSWPAALLCSAAFLIVQALTYACSPKRDFISFALSCVGGVMLAISHFQGSFVFVPDLALAFSLALVLAVKTVFTLRSSSPVWSLAFLLVVASAVCTSCFGPDMPSFQRSWFIAAASCSIVADLMGFIPFGKARMTTEYWVSSAVIACLAAFLAAAVSVNF